MTVIEKIGRFLDPLIVMRHDDRYWTPNGNHRLQAPLLTLGFCYEQRPRFSGGAHQPVLKRIDEFLGAPLKKTLTIRDARATRLLAIDDKVTGIVAALPEELRQRHRHRVGDELPEVRARRAVGGDAPGSPTPKGERRRSGSQS